MRRGAAACRVVGILIAIAAVVDPSFSITRTASIPARAVRLTQGEKAELRLPCEPSLPCVIVADGSLDAEIPQDLRQPLSLVRVTNNGSPNIAIRSVGVPSGQHVGAAGSVRVSVEGRAVTGQRTVVEVRDAAASPLTGGLVVGSVVLDWKADGSQTVEVPFWPVAAGARALRVTAAPLPSEAIAFDNQVDLGVEITETPFRILVFDARPSWSSTFVRRALEDDPRFVVEHRARVAPAIAAATANGRLDAASLDAAAVLVVGAPDALAPGDVDLIDRFVRTRGGTAILLPERAPDGPPLRLFDGRWREELIAEPRAAGPLRASELLQPVALRPTAAVIAPGIVVTPAGHGRLIVSGAMDAWRHRGESAAAFDTFWRSLAAEGAVRGQRLLIEFDDVMARAGARHSFLVRYRRMTTEPKLSANAVARCGPVTARMIRLWPAGAFGTFRGELPIENAETCIVDVAVNDVHATASVAVDSAPSRVSELVLEQFARAARASGGAVTDEDNLEPIHALNQGTPQLIESRVHPMRSPWWIVPFAGLLSIEWWARRRAGLR